MSLPTIARMLGIPPELADKLPEFAEKLPALFDEATEIMRDIHRRVVTFDERLERLELKVDTLGKAFIAFAENKDNGRTEPDSTGGRDSGTAAGTVNGAAV